MGKKRVVKRVVKRPRNRKGGAVAKREAKPERLALKEIRKKKKPKQRGAIPLYGCRRPLRIKRNGSRKKKRDAEVEQKRRHLRSLLSPSSLVEIDAFVVDLEIVREVKTNVAGCLQDRITGDSGIPD